MCLSSSRSFCSVVSSVNLALHNASLLNYSVIICSPLVASLLFLLSSSSQLISSHLIAFSHSLLFSCPVPSPFVLSPPSLPTPPCFPQDFVVDIRGVKLTARGTMVVNGFLQEDRLAAPNGRAILVDPPILLEEETGDVVVHATIVGRFGRALSSLLQAVKAGKLRVGLYIYSADAAATNKHTCVSSKASLAKSSIMTPRCCCTSPGATATSTTASPPLRCQGQGSPPLSPALRSCFGLGPTSRG